MIQSMQIQKQHPQIMITAQIELSAAGVRSSAGLFSVHLSRFLQLLNIIIQFKIHHEANKCPPEPAPVFLGLLKKACLP